jgi:type I restriction enzyme M protein
MRERRLNNYSILKEIMSKFRRSKLPLETDYIIIYTFLYKYCSDNIKNYLLEELRDEELTLDEAYRNKHSRELLRFDALKLYGFFIEKSEAFIDEVLNNNFLHPKFLSYFLRIFPQNVAFSPEYHNIEYFNFLFKTIDDVGNLRFSSEESKNIAEIIYLISKLDISDSNLEFTKVFDIVSASRVMRTDSNPQYITQILSSIVLADKKAIGSAYDPFMKDGQSLIALHNALGFDFEKSYGKDKSQLNYLYVIVRLFIDNFSFNNVFLKEENALDSIDIDGTSFDAILSRVPISIKNYHSKNLKQNLEISKRNKRNELENILLENFAINDDSFKRDSELNRALENLVEKINIEDNSNMDFTGEFESLKDSEFLFLLNLIDSLKSDGIMAISISENFLFKSSLEILRKYLTLQKNYIDTIIRIPSEINRSGSEVVIVFKKNRNVSEVLFADMSADYEVQRSDLAFPGTFRKNIILDDRTIGKMVNVYLNRLTLPKFSNLISISEIVENNYNLSVSRYVDTFEGEFISLDELVAEKQDIESNINDLNKKIERMMDDLGIRF